MTPWSRIPVGTRWMMFSYLAGFVFQGGYFVVVARTLGPSDYGTFTGALALAGALAALAGFGAGNVLVMETARDRRRYRIQMGTALVYVSSSFMPLALIALLIGGFNAPSFLRTIAPMLVSELVFARVIDYGLQAFQAHDMLKGTATVNAAVGFARLCVVVVFAALGGGDAPHWSAYYAATNVALALVVIAICGKLFGNPQLDRTALRSTWRNGIFFSIGMASRTVYADADKYLLVRFGLEHSAGQYSAANKMLNMAFTPIQAAVYSYNTRLFRAGTDGFEAVWVLVRRLLSPIVGYSVAAASSLLLVSPFIPRLLGAGYAEATSALQILAPILVFQGLHFLFGDALMGLGRQAWRSSAQMAVALISVTSNVLLIPRFGWHVAAFTALGSSALLFLLTFTLFMRGLHIERQRARRCSSVAGGLVL